MIYIKNIKLNNFRCFKTKSFCFKPNINILIGNNGCGKTSVVEGISYLCLGKSFRGAKDREVLGFDCEYFNIISTISENCDEKVIISYDKSQKRIKKEEYVYKTLSEYVGLYKLISFSPDDLYIIKGAPATRRTFIDTFLSQYDSNYLKSLSEYKKTLKIRNEFLKNIENDVYDKVMLDVIDDKLVSSGCEIIKLREKYINLLNQYLILVSKDLLKEQESITVSYDSELLNKEFKEIIKNNRKIDILSKTTTQGPQRDDLKIGFNGVDASSFSSQGQIRVAVLGLKLAMYEMFLKQNDNIIVILDDVFSELDKNKQELLMKYVKKVGQVFITTTDVDKLPSELKENSNIIKVKEGETNVW